MTLGELFNALRETGAALDEDVRASIDPGVEDTAGINEVVAGCDGVLLVLDVSEGS
jgi:hypothetical protein